MNQIVSVFGPAEKRTEPAPLAVNVVAGNTGSWRRVAPGRPPLYGLTYFFRPYDYAYTACLYAHPHIDS